MSDQMRVIVVGGGRVGHRAARLLRDRGHDLVVVEADRARREEISDEGFATVIAGDGVRPRILRQADPEEADAVAALTGNVGTNLAVCLLAREMSPEIRTVMRVDSGEPEEFADMVDAVVFPEWTGARMAANAIVGLTVHALEGTMGELEMLEIQVADGAPAEGKALSDIRLPEGSVVVSQAGGHRVARADTVLEAGERYTVAIEPGVVDEVLNLFRS